MLVAGLTKGRYGGAINEQTNIELTQGYMYNKKVAYATLAIYIVILLFMSFANTDMVDKYAVFLAILTVTLPMFYYALSNAEKRKKQLKKKAR